MPDARNSGWPKRATTCAVRGVVSGVAFSARNALTTSSNGDFTFARYASAAKNSGDVTIVRTVSRMSPLVRLNVSAARSTSDAGGSSLTNRRASFVRDEARGRWMARDDVEHLLAVLDAASRGQPLAEDGLLAGVVHDRPEDEPAAAARLLERPPGERARDLDDVLLRVAAVDAERVQLEQLAGVVLVEASTIAD